MEDPALIPVDSIQRALAPVAIRLYHPFWNWHNSIPNENKSAGRDPLTAAYVREALAGRF